MFPKRGIEPRFGTSAAAKEAPPPFSANQAASLPLFFDGKVFIFTLGQLLCHPTMNHCWAFLLPTSR